MISNEETEIIFSSNNMCGKVMPRPESLVGAISEEEWLRALRKIKWATHLEYIYYCFNLALSIIALYSWWVQEGTIWDFFQASVLSYILGGFILAMVSYFYIQAHIELSLILTFYDSKKGNVLDAAKFKRRKLNDTGRCWTIKHNFLGCASPYIYRWDQIIILHAFPQGYADKFPREELVGLITRKQYSTTISYLNTHHWLSCALASIFYVSFCYTLVWFFTNRDRTPNFVLIIGFLTSKPLLYIYQYYLLQSLNKNIYFGAFHGPKLTAPFVGKPMWEIDVHHLQATKNEKTEIEKSGVNNFLTIHAASSSISMDETVTSEIWNPNVGADDHFTKV